MRLTCILCPLHQVTWCYKDHHTQPWDPYEEREIRGWLGSTLLGCPGCRTSSPESGQMTIILSGLNYKIHMQRWNGYVFLWCLLSHRLKIEPFIWAVLPLLEYFGVEEMQGEALPSPLGLEPRMAHRISLDWPPGHWITSHRKKLVNNGLLCLWR